MRRDSGGDIGKDKKIPSPYLSLVIGRSLGVLLSLSKIEWVGGDG